MEDKKSLPENNMLSTMKETSQPAEVTENGSVNGGSSSTKNPSQKLEVLSKELPGIKDNRDEEEKPESTSWLLTGWGVHYGSRD